ncbi:MAG: UDP-N-acetylglucosamine--N-acetylmuramyl-(pentapeptide) pyrophosphoryl-undecaprenol N-acetylglucosamine transferase [Candidatus Saccharimonadales bacterium]
MRIVLAGGGSGGHVTPVVAVAKALVKSNPDIDLHFIGLAQQMEKDLIGPLDIKMHKIVSGKMRRYSGGPFWENLLDLRMKLLNIWDFFKLIIGIILSIWLLLKLRPDRVFCKGGYVSLPVGIAAWLLRKPLIIHESDVHIGLSNRILARLTPYRISGFDVNGFLNLGNPIREDIFRPSSLGKSDFGITTDKPVVLIVGGSLGASSINSVVSELAEKTATFEIIHVAGEGKEEKSHLNHYHSYSFLSEELAGALQLADVVVARAGANTLLELAALGKAAIIVPHPKLSGNHQYENAKVMADKQAAILLPQDELNVDNLEAMITKVIQNSNYREELEKNIKEFANISAASVIAGAILDPQSVFKRS